MPTPSQPKELTPKQQELLEVARACGERQVKEGSLEAMRNFTASLQAFRDSVLATDVAAVAQLMGKNFLGAEAWQKGFGVDVGVVPVLPKELTLELLESPCPINPHEGLKIKDTHILMLVPKTVDGEPYTALKLDELCSTRKGTGDKLIDGGWNNWKTQSWAAAEQIESEWVLIPKRDPDPAKVAIEKHFRSKNVASQETVHDTHYKEYREVKAIEVMTAALLNDLINGGPRLFEDYYLRTIELNASGGPGRVCVGPFYADGFEVLDDDDDGDLDNVSRALARKFRLR